MENFADRLDHTIRTKDSSLVVGIDPDPAKLPPEIRERFGIDGPGIPDPAAAAAALEAFGREVIDAVSGAAAAVKAQAAYFERWGGAGMDALARVLSAARAAGLIAIADIKRGDIGSTAEAYADAYLGDTPGTVGPHADAVTVAPLLGSDSVRPFLARAQSGGRGVFVLVRTSNPSASEIQDLAVGGRPLYERIADLVRAWGEPLRGACGFSAVGGVVGATTPAAAARVRALLPDAFLLIPGVGAQGGRPEDLGPAFAPGGRGVIVNSSRGVIYAFAKKPEIPWREAIRQAAADTRNALNRARRGS
ncbi:MAG: orotidine-5'-phosphate decarboxylase [Planctomycetes bacterium]|nr:orotidine-5'-phosphate decarboxylase [Planctomycetota bacterium]